MESIGKIMDGVVLADESGRVILLNAVAEDLLGLKSVLAIGKSVAELEGCEELLQCLRADQSAISEQDEICRTVEIHHDQKELLYIRSTTNRIISASGEFAGAVSFLRDVTANYKADQLRNQYLSILAHELRTPLTGIKTLSSLLSSGTLGKLEQTQKDAIDSICVQSLRLEHQIDHLVHLGRLDPDQHAQDLEVCEVADLLTEAARPFLQMSGDGGASFGVQTPAQPVWVGVDRAEIRRALQAMIENAFKFTPDTGRIDLCVAADGEAVQFTLQDTGVGIDPRYHRRIFEKFFQVEDPLTRRHGGAGLGLFVAARVIEAHGSFIDVGGDLGEGAKFSFELPEVSEPMASDVAKSGLVEKVGC